MTHVNADALQLELDGVAQPRLPRCISVSKYRANRRDQGELVENCIAADVACVKNQLDTGERGVHVRADETMRIRDEPDHTGFATHCSGSPPHRADSWCGTPTWSSTRATTKLTRSSMPVGRW